MTRPGCAVADGPDPKLWVRVIAHELGHFLNLEHPEEQPGAKGSFSDRLMFGGLGLDTLLSKAEVARARASLGARLECQPLRLVVMGAAPLGGRFSDTFIAVREAGRSVIVEATGPPALLAQGPVTWSGDGAEVPGKPFQRSVSRADVTSKGIKATLAGFSREVRVIVVEFDLEVEGAKPVSSGSTTFVATREKGLEVLIRALVSPPLTIVPDDVVRWQGDALGGAGPFERTVSRSQADVELVRATVGGTTLERTIVILEAVLTDDALKTVKDTVQIEGVRDENRKSRQGKLQRADLLPIQQASLFRIRADVPGVNGNTLKTFLTSRSPQNTDIETAPIELSRTTGDRFVSRPILAIPSLIPRSDIDAVDLEVIRTQAGGRLRLEVAGFPGHPLAETNVRGRVVHIFAQSFQGSGGSEEIIRSHVEQTRAVWTQAGIEVRERKINMNIADPGTLKNFEVSDVTKNSQLTDDERLLLGIAGQTPPRSPVATDLNVFYVQSLRTREDDPTPVGNTYDAADFRQPTYSLLTIVLEMSGNQKHVLDLAHEMGHMFLKRWPKDDHLDPRGNAWPPQNLMHEFSTGKGGDLDRTQVENVLGAIQDGKNSFVVLV